MHQIIATACANHGAALEWIAGILGVSVGASALANLRSHLPAPLLKLLDILALNLVKAAAQAASEARPPSLRDAEDAPGDERTKA